jgi:hypothetical protein
LDAGVMMMVKERVTGGIRTILLALLGTPKR